MIRLALSLYTPPGLQLLLAERSAHSLFRYLFDLNWTVSQTRRWGQASFGISFHWNVLAALPYYTKVVLCSRIRQNKFLCAVVQYMSELPCFWQKLCLFCIAFARRGSTRTARAWRQLPFIIMSESGSRKRGVFASFSRGPIQCYCCRAHTSTCIIFCLFCLSAKEILHWR